MKKLNFKIPKLSILLLVVALILLCIGFGERGKANREQTNLGQLQQRKEETIRQINAEYDALAATEWVSMNEIGWEVVEDEAEYVVQYELLLGPYAMLKRETVGLQNPYNSTSEIDINHLTYYYYIFGYVDGSGELQYIALESLNEDLLSAELPQTLYVTADTTEPEAVRESVYYEAFDAYYPEISQDGQVSLSYKSTYDYLLEMIPDARCIQLSIAYTSEADYLEHLESRRTTEIESVAWQVDTAQTTIAGYRTKMQKYFIACGILLLAAIAFALLKNARSKTKQKTEGMRQAAAKIIGRQFDGKDFAYELMRIPMDTVKANLHRADKETLRNFLLYLDQQEKKSPVTQTIYAYAQELYSQLEDQNRTNTENPEESASR